MSSLTEKGLLYADIFGRFFIFEHNYSQRYRSISGGVLSLVTFFIIVGLGIIFSLEFIKREAPTISMSNQMLEDSKIYMSNITPVISLSSLNGTAISNPMRFISINAYRKDIYVNRTNNFVSPVQFSFSECDFHELGSTNIKFLYQELENENSTFYCIDSTDESYFENNFAEIDSSFIQIEFEKCQVESVCDQDSNNVLRDFMVSMRFVNSYVNFNNYTTPVQNFMSLHTQRLSYNLKTNSFISFTKNLMISAEGYLLNDDKSYEYITMTSIYVSHFIGDGPYYTVYLNAPRFGLYSKRRY